MISLTKILPLLGDTIDSKAFVDFLMQANSRPEVHFLLPQFVFLNYYELGLSVTFDTKLQTFDYIYFFVMGASENERYANYIGDLPGDTTVGDSSIAIQAKLGTPLSSAESDGEHIYGFLIDKYYVHFGFEQETKLMSKVCCTLEKTSRGRWPHHS